MINSEFSIQWHLTNKCNLNCKHCYITNEHYQELTLVDAKSIIQDVSATIDIWNNTLPLLKSINFTGGEPFLSNNLFPLIQFSKENGFIVRILSNGTLINSKIAKKIKYAGVDGVQISIDNIKSKHDSLRGTAGAFNQSVTGIHNLTKLNIPVTISCTLSRLNYKNIEELIELSLSIGVNAIRFPRLVPIGRGLNLKSELLNRSETKKIFLYLYEKHQELKEKLEVVIDDPLFSILSGNSIMGMDSIHEKNHTNLHPGGCSVGFTGICLLPDGTLLPCRKLPIPLGNAKNNSFRKIWINSNVLNMIRDSRFLQGKCGKCRMNKVCKGCRAIAFSTTGNYLGSDIQCWYNL